MINPSSSEKQINMTFEAVSAAVRAFKFSFSVISLDACTHSALIAAGKTALLSATFETINGNRIVMNLHLRNLNKNDECLILLESCRSNMPMKF